MSITLARLKSDLYLKISDSTYDAEIQELIDSIIDQAISYIDNDDYAAASDLTPEIERKLCQQINYEFRRRHDPGLASVTYPNGNINKYDIGEWLDDVKAVLFRYRRFTI